MSMNVANDHHGIFNKLVNSDAFKRHKELLKDVLSEPIWWTSRSATSRISSRRQRKCMYMALSSRHRGECLRNQLLVLSKSRKRKAPVRFTCPSNRFGLCVPVIQAGRIYGYIGICHMKKNPPEHIISLLMNFIDVLLRELQKERELAKLYETIRPRAIALSTIHTVHRLISSTLDLDELLQRLARLSMQILRASGCCVALRDEVSGHMALKACVDTSKRKRPLSRRFKKLVNKRTVLSGRILMKRNTLCVPLVEEETLGVICVFNRNDRKAFTVFDKEIMATLSEQAVIAIKNAQLYKEQENITIGSIKSLASLLETRKPGALTPSESFVRITLGIGERMHLSEDDLRGLRYAAMVHDAGEVSLSDDILSKTTKLTVKEFDIIKKHPTRSVRIISHIDVLKPVVPMILHHHENYDGTGYPKGLKGEGIPLGARIMAVSSAFSAMVVKRAYRKQLSIDAATEEVKKNAGSQFDPEVVRAFLKVIKQPDIRKLLQSEGGHER